MQWWLNDTTACTYSMMSILCTYMCTNPNNGTVQEKTGTYISVQCYSNVKMLCALKVLVQLACMSLKGCNGKKASISITISGVGQLWYHKLCCAVGGWGWQLMMCEIKEHRFVRVSVASRYNLGSCCRTPLLRRKVISTHNGNGRLKMVARIECLHGWKSVKSVGSKFELSCSWSFV